MLTRLAESTHFVLLSLAYNSTHKILTRRHDHMKRPQEDALDECEAARCTSSKASWQTVRIILDGKPPLKHSAKDPHGSINERDGSAHE